MMLIPGLSRSDRRTLRKEAYDLCARVFASKATKDEVLRLAEINEALYGEQSGMNPDLDQTTVPELAEILGREILVTVGLPEHVIDSAEAQAALRRAGVRGEFIVAGSNGSPGDVVLFDANGFPIK